MRGRRPDLGNVVPLSAGGDREGAEERLRERAKQRAVELRGYAGRLDAETRKVWDRLAPIYAHPQLDRIQAHHVETFVLACQARARYERLRAHVAEHGETYVVHTRNGRQEKSRPEVAQMNVAFQQFRLTIERFGGDPYSDRALRAAVAGQTDMFDGGVEFA